MLVLSELFTPTDLEVLQQAAGGLDFEDGGRTAVQIGEFSDVDRYLRLLFVRTNRNIDRLLDGVAVSPGSAEKLSPRNAGVPSG